MTRAQYEAVEAYMHQCMQDSAHDREHVYRVLHTAFQIAETEPEADREVLACACLLHDIGRSEQFADPRLCHAMVGGDKAFRFLREQGFPEAFAQQVRGCIQSHRYRANNPPQTLEARILFDADKLDATGAMGIARTLLYAGQVSAPLYTRDASGGVSDGKDDTVPSFFREYHFKLAKLYDRFYTRRGRELAMARREAAEHFYHAMLLEARLSHAAGEAVLQTIFREQEVQ